MKESLSAAEFLLLGTNELSTETFGNGYNHICSDERTGTAAQCHQPLARIP